VLYRQVHPKLFKNGQPTSVNFRPGGQDAGKVSVDRSSIWTAEQAYRQYVEHLRNASVGAWGFTVDEVICSGTKAWPDPLPAEPTGVPANPAHAFVDFRGLERKDIEAAAQLLKRAALDRGRLYP
jgi:hypothetical protein